MGQEYVNIEIQNRLYNHTMGLDKDALWNNIAIAQAKNPVPYWLFLAGLIFVTVLSYGAYAMLNSPNNASPQVAAVPLVDNDRDVAPESSSNTQTIATTEDSTDANVSESNTTIDHAEVILTDAAAIDNESNTGSYDDKNTESTIKNPTEAISNNAIANTRQPLVTNNSTTIVNENTAAISNTTNINEGNFNSLLEQSNSSSINEITPPNSTNAIAFSESEINNNIAASPISTQTKENLRWTDLTATLPSVNTLLLTDSEPIDFRFNRNKQSCYAFGKQRHPWSLYAYAGPSLLMKNLSTNTVESETYRSERESSEDVLESIRAGLQLKYEWESGWYAKAGLETNRLNEQLQFTTMTDSTYTLENQIIRIIVNSDGSETPVYGDITVTETKTERATIYNKYKFVNIPLAFGYNKSRNRWSYGAELGMHINLNFDFEGQLLSQNGQPIQDPDFFKGNAGLAFSLTGGIGYQILPRVKLWLTPSVMKLMRSINIDSYPIDQSYTTTGLLLGAEFKF